MNTNTNKQITTWLISALLLIFIMVIIGGITRLTQSGLSMVEWHPVSGLIPPLSEEGWLAEFENYKAFPDYQQKKIGMTLEQFKFIFFWEFVHRLIGRSLGIVFIIPFALFYFQKKLRPPLIKKLLIMFALGGLQGLMGWYMVKSGLVDNPQVSHYRLAAHLLLAFGLMAYILWTALDLNNSKFKAGNEEVRKRLYSFSILITALVGLQIIYGAFVAGLKAGFAWNTFPFMAGAWIPNGLFSFSPWWINLFENNFTVQFIHRSLGWTLAIMIPLFWRHGKSFVLTLQQNQALNWILAAVFIQFLLGVFTLLMVVPVWLGVLHQAGALMLLAVAVYNNFLLKQ